jgi:hypothetical protein
MAENSGTPVVIAAVVSRWLIKSGQVELRGEWSERCGRGKPIIFAHCELDDLLIGRTKIRPDTRTWRSGLLTGLHERSIGSFNHSVQPRVVTTGS